MPTTLEYITDRVKELSTARQNLGQLVSMLNAGIEALKAGQLPELRKAIDAASASWKSVEAEILANPQLFEKPRTHSAHGIKFGLAKGKGAIEITDPDKTVALIEKHFPEQAEVLVDVKKTPAKDAIALLPANDLKRIGCHLKAAGDQVVIKPADGAIDKLVKALVKANIDEEESAR